MEKLRVLTFVVEASGDEEETSDFALVWKAIKDPGSDEVTEGESLSENTSKDSEVHVLDLNAEIEKEETNVAETITVSTFKFIDPQIRIDPLKKIIHHPKQQSENIYLNQIL